MTKFRFTRPVREEAVKFLKNLGRTTGPATTMVAVLIGADVKAVAITGFAIYVVFELLALYILGLETEKDKVSKGE